MDLKQALSKKYYHNVLDDLNEFKKDSIFDWNEANKIAAKEWEAKEPDGEKGYNNYYINSPYYIDAMATYNATGKKTRLYSKLSKVIKSLKDVKTIVDFGCGVGSDSLEFASDGYKVIAMDLPSISLDFVKFRINKHNKSLKIGVDVVEIADSTEVPKVDLVLSLDTLEHVFDPYKTIEKLVKNKPKYLLFTTAFGIHETAEHTIPHHTDHKIAKIEKFISSLGYEKQKLKVAFPPRLFKRIKK